MGKNDMFSIKYETTCITKRPHGQHKGAKSQPFLTYEKKTNQPITNIT